MVEKHYGHLAPSYVADAIRAGAPRFGLKPDKRIVELNRRANSLSSGAARLITETPDLPGSPRFHLWQDTEQDGA